MKQYLDLMGTIIAKGVESTNRTGVNDFALFGETYTVALRPEPDGSIAGFPLLTTKKVSLKSIFIELMWKLSGSTNIRPLVEQNVHIWTEWPFRDWLQKTGEKVSQFTDQTQTTLTEEWKMLLKYYEQQIVASEEFAREWGALGITYGHNFRNAGSPELGAGKDQVLEALHRIQNNPDSRRIIIDLWSPLWESSTLLPPCPCFYQFNARVPEVLDLNMYQRSCDYFLGVPYNTAQDALLLCLIAHVTRRKPRNFMHIFGDVHVYHNHLDVCKTQLTREPRELPSIRINPEKTDLFSITWKDIELRNYDPHPVLRGEVAV